MNALLSTLTTPPLITGIMPTADRRAFARRAVAQFLAQDYVNSELLIVDDGTDRVGDLVPDHPRVRYLPLERRLGFGRPVPLQIGLAVGRPWHGPFGGRRFLGGSLREDTARQQRGEPDRRRRQHLPNMAFHGAFHGAYLIKVIVPLYN